MSGFLAHIPSRLPNLSRPLFISTTADSRSIALSRVLAGSMFSGLGVFLLFAVLAPATYAETGPDTSSLALRGREVWSATMSVGSGGRMLGAGELGGREIGGLSGAEFDWRGTRYTVTNLFYNRTTSTADAWSIAIDISPALPLKADEFGCLALLLGDRWFNLADGVGNGRQFFWYDIDLSWRSGETIEVGLREFPASFEARSITGWRNNLLRPELGMAETQLLRQAAVGFDFAMTGTMSGRLPDARMISNMVHHQVEDTPNSAGASDMLWQWGQFLDHDISLTPATITSSQAAIRIPPGDPAFDPFGTGLRLIPFDRSMIDPNSGTGADDPREQSNQISGFIDASNVYGSSSSRVHLLRTNDGTGRLRTVDAGQFLPPNPSRLAIEDGGRPRAGLFLAGDIRVNEQVALIAMHTLFVREHNRLADEIAIEHPELTGHEIFELARKIVGAQMQVITYHEFLPLLLGPRALEPYAGYEQMVNPSIANEFSTAAFRVGHTMLSPNLMLIDAEGNTDEISLAESFFNISMVREVGIDPFLRGISTQIAQEIDLALVDEIRNLLFGPPGSSGRDLAALNIQRGRDHGLPRYNMVRMAYGLPRASGFADVSSDPQVQAALALAYGEVDEIDLWTGGLAEDHVPGAMVGETFHRILADQFRRLRDGDRFWFENDPCFLSNPELLAEVRATTLAEIIRRNTRIDDEIPDNVFRGPTPTIGVSGGDTSGSSDLAGTAEEGLPVVFTLTRSGPTTNELSVEVQISESGATLSEQPSVSALATFAIGNDTATLVFETIDDGNAEYDSTVEVTIGESDAYERASRASSASVSVLDNDSVEIELEAGLNVIEWVDQDGVGVVAALTGNGDADISGVITGIYEWDEGSRRWLAFFPALEGVPGLSDVNTLRALRTGHTYQVRANQPLVWRIPKRDPSPDPSAE